MFAKKKPVINISSRSYLQPESLKVHQLVQSPKFNIEKALQQQIQRKRINQQKLARYDHYNSILAAKGIEGCNQNKQQQQSQLKIQPLISPLSNHKNLPLSTQKPQFTKPSPSQSQFQIQQQKYLHLLKEKNQNLHKKNDQLKSYLREVDAGVGQMKYILEEVEGNYDKLKGMCDVERKESGLWLNREGESSCDESLQLMEQSVQYHNDTTANPNSPKHLLAQKPISYQPQPPSTTLLLQRQQYQSQNNLELLQQIETKFKGILQRVSEHREEREHLSKKDSPIYELNRMEKQLKRIKSVDKIGGNKKPISTHLQSQKGNFQYTNSYLSPSISSQPYTKLIKSKSSKLFFS